MHIRLLYWLFRARGHGWAQIKSVFAKKEPQTCARRMSEPGPWAYKECLDWWERRGRVHKDRTCSFCGSMHPDEFIAFCREVIKDKAQTISVDFCKGYKVYVHRPDVHNSDDGAIKFYTQHLNAQTKENIGIINEAIRISREAFRAKWYPKDGSNEK